MILFSDNIFFSSMMFFFLGSFLICNRKLSIINLILLTGILFLSMTNRPITDYLFREYPFEYFAMKRFTFWFILKVFLFYVLVIYRLTNYVKSHSMGTKHLGKKQKKFSGIDKKSYLKMWYFVLLFVIITCIKVFVSRNYLSTNIKEIIMCIFVCPIFSLILFITMIIGPFFVINIRENSGKPTQILLQKSENYETYSVKFDNDDGNYIATPKGFNEYKENKDKMYFYKIKTDIFGNEFIDKYPQRLLLDKKNHKINSNFFYDKIYTKYSIKTSKMIAIIIITIIIWILFIK
ncbi:hypothetical protein [Fusobacterium sp. PH5-44]|uniref:hypothetical protein n=1 Tax=unclassified Fusobacterium TaxID=2648384 RepID=UPI003D245EE2